VLVDLDGGERQAGLKKHHVRNRDNVQGAENSFMRASTRRIMGYLLRVARESILSAAPDASTISEAFELGARQSARPSY
jgi:hypothetical protein